ncbi:MAG: Kelch repeat-containing protein, partial [bacterium]
MIILSFQVRAQEKKWQFRTPMPTPRSGITAVVFEGRICVMGGRDRKGKILDKVEIYDPVTDSWDTSFKHLKHQRENAAAVVFDGKIVVLGGRDDDGEITDKVEFFNPAKNKWENLESLIEDREGLAAVVLDGDLYALGGLGERKDREIFLNSVEIYNPANDSWSIHDDWRLQ